MAKPLFFSTPIPFEVNMIQEQRLAGIFDQLVRIDSVSRTEGRFAQVLTRLLSDLGAKVETDDAGEKTGGDSGNLYAVFPGTRQAPPLLLSAHMDTVTPGKNIVPQFKDGVFTSLGDTILGADDKSAIAVILEVLTLVREKDLPCPPLEIVFSVCEEIGLLGAKHVDLGRITAKMGYALDSGDVSKIVVKAPGANKIQFTVHGKAAHAGAEPEKGINAIQLAAKAVAQMNLGRIDGETTCNIGLIQGGQATNIVPETVVLKGEARSHDEDKLAAVTRKMVRAFEAVIPPDEKTGARLETVVERDFFAMNIPKDHELVTLAQAAAADCDMEMTLKTGGGGSDANIFFGKGLMVGILGTGMKNAHTIKESIRLADMVKSGELLLSILKHYTENGNPAK